MGKSFNGKIIEFEGIAGCGKSTLCSSFAEILEHNNITYIYSQDIAIYMHKHPLSYIRSFRIKNAVSVLRLMLSTGTFRSYRYHIAIFKLLSLYENYLRTGKESVLLCDHSIVQSAVQVWGYNSHITTDKKIADALSRFYSKTYRSKNVYCIITSEVAAQRIRKRNRSYGRLDLIKDDNELIRSLDNNAGTLDAFVKVYERTHDVCKIDMQNEPGAIAKGLFDMVFGL